MIQQFLCLRVILEQRFNNQTRHYNAAATVDYLPQSWLRSSIEAISDTKAAMLIAVVTP